jgi:glycosyltransferase involved in cell wall biosynthesis
MKRVLFIAYYTPPAGGAGVQRSAKFIKYLPDFGWQPIVLTVFPEKYRLHDPSLLADIQPDSNIHRTSAWLPPTWLPWRVRNWFSRWFLLMDENLGWYPFAVKQGEEILNKSKIDAIYSTSPPHTCHMVASTLKAHANLPWVADFRDPWIGNFSRHQPTPFHRHLDTHLEAQAINQADQILVVSPVMREDIQARYPNLEQEKVDLLENGFDKADFTVISPVTLPADRFTIVYTGSFYSQGLTPDNFLHALTTVIESQRLPRDRVLVLFIGNISHQVSELIERLGLTDLAKLMGYLPHHDSIAHLLAANLLLLILGDGPASKGVLTGKIFEYLAASKPILALAPDGAAADLVREAQAGRVIPPADISAIANALVEMYARWEQGTLDITHRPEVVARYERRNQTARLASLLDRISTPETLP